MFIILIVACKMFLSVVVILALVPGKIIGSIEDKQHVVSELLKIEDQLKEADSELNKASSAVYKLKTEVSGETSVQVESDDLTPFRPCIWPLEAWKTLLNGDLKLTMKYRKLADDVTVTWTDTENLLPASFTDLSGRVTETSVTLPYNTESSSVMIMAAICGDRGNAQVFEFRGKGENSAHQDLSGDVMPVIEMNTTRDIVYNIGQDAVFRIRTVHPRNLEKVDMEVSSSLVDLQTGKFEMRPLADYANKSVEFLDRKFDANSTEITVRMKMSERMMSGNIMISLLRTLSGSVVSYFGEYFNVFVRPSNQTGPFPPGYIHITIPAYKQTDENGAINEICRVNNKCPIICEAIGADVENVDFIQVKPDGRREHLEPGPQSFSYGIVSKYSKTSTIYLNVDQSFNTEVKYLCVATNKQGKQATQYYTVTAFMPLKIIRDRSSINTENGKLNMTCMVTGWPQPTVKFEVTTAGALGYYLDNADTMTNLGNNTYLANKLTDYDQVTMGKLMAASCIATGIKETSYDHYTFDIPLRG